ncbi:MAG: hypothetical protein GX654_00540 [Desulfatiglans sp.]|nr:hypothetical protein [Desulfatiglans sp.]
MNNNRSLDYLIKKALTEVEETATLDTGLLSEVKSRLLKEGRDTEIMAKIKFFSHTSIGRAATISCSVIIVFLFSFIFIQPVRAVAEKGIEKVRSMIYDVIKGEDGKYVAVKVPKPEPGDLGPINYTGVKKAVAKEIIARIPESLAGGFMLSSRALGYTDTSKGLALSRSVPDPADYKEHEKFNEIYEKFNERVSAIYKKYNSWIALSISHFDTPFASNSKREEFEGDNKRTICLGAIQATYAEYPGARYPIVEVADQGGYEDTTKEPIINIYHTIKWEQNGLYFTVFDLSHDLSLEELQIAATSVVESMM